VNFIHQFWHHLIAFKKFVSDSNQDWQDVYYSVEKGFSTQSQSNDLCVISTLAIEGYRHSVDILHGKLYLCYNNLSKKYIEYTKLYFPLIAAKYFYEEKPLVLAHLAQTLDGKICTDTGKSKWISNKDNLDHVHRVRAMCDAVLVGSVTMVNDKPQLNVRRVSGENPIRLFWSNSLVEFSKYNADFAKTFIIREKNKPIENTKGIDGVIYYENNHQEVSNVLLGLKKMGIHSLFIEGGSHTIRKFHEAKTVDVLQVYIAPIIFGCGKNGLEMEAIDDVDEALRIDGFFVPMGNHIMYSGRPIYK
jgi:riboflavin-specific deaminase-like protein